MKINSTAQKFSHCTQYNVSIPLYKNAAQGVKLLLLLQINSELQRLCSGNANG